jgi:hypothetical protein
MRAAPLGGERAVAAQEDALGAADARDPAGFLDDARDGEPVLEPRHALELDLDLAVQRLGDAHERVRDLPADLVPPGAGRERKGVAHP